MNDEALSDQVSLHGPSAAPLQSSAAPPSFRFHVTWTLTTRVLMAANSVLAGVIVARWLGVRELGALAVLNVTVGYAVQIGSLGLAFANTYIIAQDRRHLAPAATNSLILGLCIGAVIALATVWLAAASPQLFADISLRLVAIAALSIPFQLISLLGLNIFLAVGLIKRFTLIDLAAQSLILVNALIALVVVGRGLSALITLNSLTAIGVSFIIVCLVARYIVKQRNAGRWRVDATLFSQTMRYGFKMQLQIIASLLLFRVDLLLVKYFRGSAEAGVYSVASQVALMLMLLPGVISTLLFPRIAARQDERGTLVSRVTRHTAFVMFLVCLLAAPAIFALPLLYGPAFGDAVTQSLILLPGVFLVSIAGVLSQHFSGTGLPLPIPLFWVFTLVFNTLLNLAVVPRWGARGAALSSSVSYGLIFVLITLYFRARTGNRIPNTFLLHRSELRELLKLRRFGIHT